MKWHAYHNGKRIPYWLGALIGLDQFAGALWPGAHVDQTISHRIGVKRVKLALKREYVNAEEVLDEAGEVRPAETYTRITQKILKLYRLPFWKHPLAATIDWMLEKIDPGHSIDAIGS